jgi:hypothetical protein
VNKENLFRGACIAGLFASTLGCASDNTKYIDLTSGTPTATSQPDITPTPTPSGRIVGLRGEKFTVTKVGKDLFRVFSTKNWWELSRNANDDLEAGFSAIADRCKVINSVSLSDRILIKTDSNDRCLPELD